MNTEDFDRSQRRRPQILLGLTVASVAAAFLIPCLNDRVEAYQEQIAASVAAVLDQARSGVPVVAPAGAEASAADTLATLTADLPAPVRRYFTYAFPEGPRPLQGVRMRLEGEFRLPQATGFGPMTAVQYAAVTDPAFVFVARTPLVPKLVATAVDQYIDGEAEMSVRLLSLVRIRRETGAALSDTSLMRYVLEGALFPTALLPGPHLRWEPIDDTAARAVVSRGGTEVGAFRVSFDADGGIARMTAEGTAVDTGRYHGSGEDVVRSDYQLIDGVRVPTRFEISRVLGGEVQPFWRGEVTELAFDHLAPF